MLDIDTFLTTLYVMVDDFCKNQLPIETRQSHLINPIQNALEIGLIPTGLETLRMDAYS